MSVTPAQLRATLTADPASAEDIDMDAEERRERLLDAELADDAGTGPSSAGAKRIEEKTLDEYGFLTGDLLSLCVALPRPPKAAGAGPGALKAGAGAAPEPRGAWGRGEPLPPQEFRRRSADRGGYGHGGHGGRGGHGGHGGRGGDSWRRDRSRSPAREREGWRR